MTKSLKVLLVLGLGLFIGNQANAAGAARGAKPSFALNYTTTVSTVAVGPVVLYSVIMATAAANEYTAFFDSASASGITINYRSTGFKGLAYFQSTSSNTWVNFDPPLQFNNGLMVADSASTGQTLWVYERGKVGQGY